MGVLIGLLPIFIGFGILFLIARIGLWLDERFKNIFRIIMSLAILSGMGWWIFFYDPNYCYKEDKKYTDADFKDGLSNSAVVMELARNYGLVRVDEHIRNDGMVETDYNQDDMKKLEAEVDVFYKKYPHLKFGEVSGKGYTYDSDWDYAVEGARYFFAPKDIQIVNNHLKKRPYPPKKTVVGIYYGAFYSKCGKYTGDPRIGDDDVDIYESSKTDLDFNPYKKGILKW
jgi:hypothetical protein